MSNASFLPDPRHFDLLVEGLDEKTLKLLGTTRNTRIETTSFESGFVVYEMGSRGLNILDRISKPFFSVSSDGAPVVTLRSEAQDRVMALSVAPIQAFNYGVVLHLPLNPRITWKMKDDGSGCVLEFPIVIRTASRRLNRETSRHNLRERGVTFFESFSSFDEEFGKVAY